MERAAGRIADLTVGLDDGVAGGQFLFHVGVDVTEDLGEQGLAFGGEDNTVAVLGEPVDEVLGQVRTAHDAELAEEGVSAGV